jgi:hypothetical protein
MSSAGFRQVLHGEEVPRSIISTVVFPALVLGEKTITMRAAFECTRTLERIICCCGVQASCSVIFFMRNNVDSKGSLYTHR